MLNDEPKIIHLVGQFGVGGVENMLINILKYRVQNGFVGYDLIQCSNPPEYYDATIKSLGCIGYHTTIRSEGFFKRLKELYKIFKNYDIIHIHTQNAALQFFDALMAKMQRAKKIVVHCHNTSDWRSQRMNKLHKLFRWPLYILADEHLACGEDAGRWMYGNRYYKIIPLPIDCDKYIEKKQNHSDVRLIHVGRFDEVKNHEMVFKIFREYLKLNNDSTLTLLGDGMLRQTLLEKNKDLGDKIIAPGNVDNVNDYLCNQDVFILPQKYEGFPTVLLEAQAAGLKCFVSDRVTAQINLTDTIEFIQLGNSPDEWAMHINKHILQNRKIDNKKCNDIIREQYDIQIVNKILQEYWKV